MFALSLRSDRSSSRSVLPLPLLRTRLPVPGRLEARPRMSSHSSAALRELTDAANGRSFALYVRLTSQTHLTVCVLTAPSASGAGGVCRQFRGDLCAALQPASLASAVRDNNWPARVCEALLGHEGKAKYQFEVRDIAVAADHGAAADGDDATAAAASARRKKAAAAVPSSRGELKILYRGGTLIKLPLTFADPSAPPNFASYRTDTLKLCTRVSELATELSSRLATREAAMRAATAKIQQQLAALETKAMQKRWMEEGVLAQIYTLLQTKDAEINRLKEEQKTCQKATAQSSSRAEEQRMEGGCSADSCFAACLPHPASCFFQCTLRSALCSFALS